MYFTKKQAPKNKNYFGFTLVELIVVIVILAILALIAFLSFASYLALTRNSTRLSDISSINSSLELFQIKSGSYPIPDNSFDISYLGGSIWKQGTISDNFIRKLGNVSKKVVDLLTNTEYIYSALSYSKNSFAIKADYEGSSISYKYFDSPMLNFDEVYSENTDEKVAYIKGNYLNTVAKTITGNTVYVLAIPTIISNFNTNTEISTTNLSGTLLYNGQSSAMGINYNPSDKIVVFSGSSLPANDNSGLITNMTNNIINTYSGSVIVNLNPSIKELLNTNSNNISSVGQNIIKNHLGGIIDNNSTGQSVSGWSIIGGGNCDLVDNSLGNIGDISTCIDNRIYTMQGLATHDKIYSLLKAEGKWRFNENLAYPPTTGYNGDNSWSASDSGLYSCPGINDTGTADCSLVSSLGYLYQWSTAMVGGSPNDNAASRSQGICPDGWAIPTKSDFTSVSDSYWPEADFSRNGNTTGWISTYAGHRNLASGNYSFRTIEESLWTSSTIAPGSGVSWYGVFSPGSTANQSLRNVTQNSSGNSVRCIKN